jgi:hypothetical protein
MGERKGGTGRRGKPFRNYLLGTWLTQQCRNIQRQAIAQEPTTQIPNHASDGESGRDGRRDTPRQLQRAAVGGRTDVEPRCRFLPVEEDGQGNQQGL